MTPTDFDRALDPKLDLRLERVVPVAREKVWKAWTVPAHLKRWFTPAPWKTVEAELDLRPGGLFRTVMESPEGQRFPSVGCYLEVVAPERLVWTNALLPGFRPAPPVALDPATKDCHDLTFTCILTLEAVGAGTRYVARALHRDEAGAQAHARMGFQEGWGAALDQLVALARDLP